MYNPTSKTSLWSLLNVLVFSEASIFCLVRTLMECHPTHVQLLRNRFTGTPIQFSWSLSLHSFLLVSSVSHKFHCLSVPGRPSPFSQFHETAVLCQGFPSLSYGLESAPLGKIRVIVGPTLFLFSQGSPLCAAYCPLSENSCFIFS